MNPKVRALVKAEVRRKTTVLYAGVSRQGVSVVRLRVKIGGQVLEALGTAKWQKPDVFDTAEGIDRAQERAVIELVDRLLSPYRRGFSTRLV